MSSFLRRIERQRVPSNKVHPVYDTREKAPKPNSLGARGSRRKTKFRPFRNRISEVVGEA